MPHMKNKIPMKDIVFLWMLSEMLSESDVIYGDNFDQTVIHKQ